MKLIYSMSTVSLPGCQACVVAIDKYPLMNLFSFSKEITCRKAQDSQHLRSSSINGEVTLYTGEGDCKF